MNYQKANLDIYLFESEDVINTSATLEGAGNSNGVDSNESAPGEIYPEGHGNPYPFENIIFDDLDDLDERDPV